MHSAIVAVEMPHDPGRQIWSNFLAAIIKLNGNKNVATLGENVWQINFQSSPVALAILVDAAEKMGLVYRILPFDAEPQWLPAGSNPKPK